MKTWDHKKILWGILMAVLTVLFVLYAPPFIFKLAMIPVVGICLKELMEMSLPKHPSSSPLLGVGLGCLLSVVILFSKTGYELWVACLALIIIVTFAYYLFCDHDLTLAFSQIAFTVFGCLYIGCLFSYTGLLRARENGDFWIFLVAGSTFMADTSAYFAGHLFGKHKLAPRVSPGKTIEGLIGGIAGSVIAAFLCRFFFWQDFAFHDCIVLGILIGIVGPLGDLSESLIKRSVGVKDSGELIPGHGGLLDRLDAVLFTAPLIYYYSKIFY